MSIPFMKCLPCAGFSQCSQIWFLSWEISFTSPKKLRQKVKSLVEWKWWAKYIQRSSP